jgi:hypothetical protein
MTEKKQAEKYVVTGTMVNDWPQGTVISREQLVIPKQGDTPEHDQFDRLTQLGVIRPALEHEAGQPHVTLPLPGLTPAQQAKLSTLDATIESLTQAVAAHEERARAHERLRGLVAPLPSPEEDPGFDLTVKEREARLEALKRRLDVARQQADEHVKALNQQTEQRQQEAPEGMPTGQAIPLPVDESTGHAGPATEEPHRGRRRREGNE